MADEIDSTNENDPDSPDSQDDNSAELSETSGATETGTPGETTSPAKTKSSPEQISPAETMLRAKQQRESPKQAALRDISSLPGYARSLLKIEVPVMVSLADKKQPIAEILDLRPGALIQFKKPCGDMLDLEVGGYRVAVGEAVKVGDKFGLRITSMITPDERFRKVQGRDEKIMMKEARMQNDECRKRASSTTQ